MKQKVGDVGIRAEGASSDLERSEGEAQAEAAPLNLRGGVDKYAVCSWAPQDLLVQIVKEGLGATEQYGIEKPFVGGLPQMVRDAVGLDVEVYGLPSITPSSPNKRSVLEMAIAAPSVPEAFKEKARLVLEAWFPGWLEKPAGMLMHGAMLPRVKSLDDLFGKMKATGLQHHPEGLNLYIHHTAAVGPRREQVNRFQVSARPELWRAVDECMNRGADSWFFEIKVPEDRPEADLWIRGNTLGRDWLVARLPVEEVRRVLEAGFPVAVGRNGQDPEARFTTIKEGEAYVATNVIKRDPAGVDAGEYYIDAPEQEGL